MICFFVWEITGIIYLKKKKRWPFLSKVAEMIRHAGRAIAIKW